LRPWGFVAVALAPLPIYLWVLEGLAGQVLWSCSVAVMLAVALVAAIRLPRHRSAWMLILAGQALFLIGDMWLAALEFIVESDSFPSMGDVFYLLGYVLIGAGIALLVRAQGPLRDLGGVVDGVIVAIGAGVLLWVYLISPTAADQSVPLLERIVTVAYPAGDLLLFTIGAQLAVSAVRRLAPLWLLGASLLTLLAADIGYAAAVLTDTYGSGGLLDTGWWLSYVFVVAAVLHPRAVELTDEDVVPAAPRLSTARLATLAAVSLSAPVVLAIELAIGDRGTDDVLVGGTIVLFALVVLRLALVNRELERGRRRLLHDATHDALTGLANRVLLADLVERALGRRQPEGRYAAVLCLDLDDFKSVNDTLGHADGDRLLYVIAERLQRLTRGSDVVARLGGDEFAILLESVTPENALEVADRAIATIRQPVDLGDDVRIHPDTSIGVTYGSRGDSVDGVLRDADIAMYLAKSHGKGRWEVFQPGMRQHVVERLALRAELWGAIDRDELVLHYQPIADVATGAITGAEALVRWQHPIRGLIEPARFVGIAEETGLIVSLGRWVLREACREAQSWDPSPDGIEVAVNLSARQLEDPDLVAHVRAALDATGLAPYRLLVELTESAMVTDLDEAAARLRELKRLGVRVGLDDFGSGFTSVQHLRAFPLDMVKFDRVFVQTSLADDASILRGLLTLASGLGLQTVAEGVETPRQLAQLSTMACDSVQGYLIARPAPASAIDLRSRPFGLTEVQISVAGS
jgi:diguanylate cyclase